MNPGGSPGADDPLVTPTTFSQWQPMFFSPGEIANANIAGLAADPDADGLPNVMEFASNSNPVAPDSPHVMEVTLAKDGNAGPYLTLKYRRLIGVEGLQFHGDTGNAPDAWTLDGAVEVGAPVNNSDGTETVTLRDTVASSEAGQRFIRLRIVGG